MFQSYYPFYAPPHYWYNYYYYYYNRMNDPGEKNEGNNYEHRDDKDGMKNCKKKMEMMPHMYCPAQAAAEMPMYGQMGMSPMMQPMMQQPMCPMMQAMMQQPMCPMMQPMMQGPQMCPMAGVPHQGLDMMDGEE